MAEATIRATYFGTTSIYLTDGSNGIFVDAFLSRPSLLRASLGRVSPNRLLIAKTLEEGNVQALDAVFTAHSHYDHALDSADVVQVRGGDLYGSESTLNIGRGAGLSESRLHRIADGDEHSFGDFTVRVFEGLHSPGNRCPGNIDKPLRTPARVSAFKDGGSFSYLITHPSGTTFVHASANYVPDKFEGVNADVLYLGVGALGAQDKQFQDAYWHHVVEAIRPKVIIPVHWDNFGRPLTRGLHRLPRFMDDFSATQKLLAEKTAGGAVEIRWQDAMETITI